MFALYRYCAHIHKDLVECFRNVDTRFLYSFLCWVCDQRRGKGGRRQPGIKSTSSLGTFWKWYLLVYNQEVGHKIDPMIQVQGQDVRSVLLPRWLCEI